MQTISRSTVHAQLLSRLGRPTPRQRQPKPIVRAQSPGIYHFGQIDHSVGTQTIVPEIMLDVYQHLILEGRRNEHIAEKIRLDIMANGGTAQFIAVVDMPCESVEDLWPLVR